MKALLVDDEQHCRENLSILLRNHCPEVKAIETAYSVDKAAEIIPQFEPDIIFLDIRMPGKDGFHLINLLDTSKICIVFVTAHDEYALQSIKCGPTAYLLKPIDTEELVEAVRFAFNQQLIKLNSLLQYKEAISNLTTSLEHNRAPDKICLSHASKLQIVALSEIIYLSSDNYYTTFHLDNGSQIVMAKTLKYYHEILDNRFIRVHRSFLVNVNHIKDFLYDQGLITVSNNAKLMVSRRRVNEVVQRMRQIS